MSVSNPKTSLLKNNNNLEEVVLTLYRQLKRERLARKEAEEILETKSRELYLAKIKTENDYKEALEKRDEVNFYNSLNSLSFRAMSENQLYYDFFSKIISIVPWSNICFLKHQSELDTFKNTPHYFSAESTESILGNYFLNEKQEDLELSGPLKKSTLDRGEFVLLKDKEKYPEQPRLEFFKTQPIDFILYIPILFSHKLYGIFEYISFSSDPVNTSKIDITKSATQIFTNVLYKHITQKDLEKNYKDLKEINQKIQQTQAQLVQSEKMASLGMLSAGVAHEINNPAAYIITNLGTLKSYFQNIQNILNQKEIQDFLQTHLNEKDKKELQFISDDMPVLVQESIDGGNKIKEIVSGLKSFSRTDEAEMKFANLNDCIESSLKMLSNELKYKCTIEKDLGNIPEIQCYPGQLNQVLVNLIVNASQAMKESGTIWIRSKLHEQNIVIEVEDNGSGMSEEIKEKLFTPFFTTKPVGKGTGLGLSISFGIIQKHKGSIECESTVEKGTLFRITLPL